jgi:hypothetical protein
VLGPELVCDVCVSISTIHLQESHKTTHLIVADFIRRRHIGLGDVTGIGHGWVAGGGETQPREIVSCSLAWSLGVYFRFDRALDRHQSVDNPL